MVEVDNTLPTVNVGLSGITYEGKYSAKLTASTADLRLKNWTIQVGTGENPLLWNAVAEGIDNLPNYINNITSPDLGSLKYKRFRIVAEDFAGNQSVATTPFIESKVVIESMIVADGIGTAIPIIPDKSVTMFKGTKYLLYSFETIPAPNRFDTPGSL